MSTGGIAPRAGWYPDAYGTLRYWDGYAWTNHIAPPPPAVPQQYAGPPQHPAPFRMVAKTRRGTNHTFHLLMTVFTVGLWGIFVWPWVTIYNAVRYDRTVTKVHY